MTQTNMTQDLDLLQAGDAVDETSTRATLQATQGMYAQLKRTEAALALVLGALTEFHEGAADYVMHRLSMELKRLAEQPETAARLLGCPVVEIDSHLLQAIAAHLYGSRDNAVWAAASLDAVVWH
ncbi:MAG: hypothetical protein ACYDD1_14395 [Caulobacteraceae bacterium]